MPGRRSPASGRPLTEEVFKPQWSTWWYLNRWSFLPLRGSLAGPDGKVVTPEVRPALTPEQRRAIDLGRRVLVARQSVVPYLLKLLGPASRARTDVRASALIALAKTSTDVRVRSVIRRYALEPTADPYVRESAALALGLLRRTDPELQLDAGALDVVRKWLLDLAADERVPWRARAFSVYAIGLLADQPQGPVFSADGNLVARELLRRLRNPRLNMEMRMAVFTALGLQPRKGLPAEVSEELKAIAAGRRLHKIRWSDEERSHALTALARLRVPAWELLVFRVLTSHRAPAVIRRAAFLAAGRHAVDLTPAMRRAAVDAIQVGLTRSRDELTRGLGLVALGRTLAADLGAGSLAVLEAGVATERLFRDVRSGTQARRGYAVLALGLAAHGANAKVPAHAAFRKRAGELLAAGLKARRGDDVSIAAYAVGLGLVGEGGAVDALVRAAADARSGPQVRSCSGVALAQVGTRSARVRKLLFGALNADKSDFVRAEAALALSCYGGSDQTLLLCAAVEQRSSQRVRGVIAISLGNLGDLEAAPALLRVARDGKSNSRVRAEAIAALGLLCDPEERPSLDRIREGANYTGMSNGVYELIDIL